MPRELSAPGLLRGKEGKNNSETSSAAAIKSVHTFSAHLFWKRLRIL